MTAIRRGAGRAEETLGLADLDVTLVLVAIDQRCRMEAVQNRRLFCHSQPNRVFL